ncbi:MAG: class I SAM-dependent methyltransferase [Ignavibacteria bacterium]|nr:class I SAM-dependent methyltransferase [Ignavibacteria bacterium]
METAKIPWYADENGFYSEDYFDIVNIASVNEMAASQCDFIEKVLQLPKGSKILDLCCGHGRLSVPLAQRGFDMTGQDINSYFLKIAGEEALKNGLKINFIRGDMRQIDFSGHFDAVLNMFTSLGALESDEEDEKVFREVNKALKPGGKFIVEYVNKDFIFRRFMESDAREIPGGYVRINRFYNHLTSSHRETYDIYRNDELVKHIEIKFRFYALTELIAMLERSGFSVRHVFGGFDDIPVSFDSKSCFIVSEKTK